MNGIHDVGGKHGFGPVIAPKDEPVFRAEWERRMFGMFILAANAGFFNVDKFRYAVENMDPAHYLSSPYYEHWLEGLLFHAKRHGVVTQEEFDARVLELAGGE
ncbi:nitrile hydratase subunit beta [Agrobacterium tumefaciens]|uniref:SH3-like domain-containing protein n=1 Tax=Agrobacterium tumefaciens TaxID=358 RepID=UPI0015737729|nr:SH3-like domain-containing protein [Agrobacterium tumefaciens]NTB94907.1 nitrile hydratase subunit beta [Agrobacterium tumefaciens]NTC44028.1 nitrile hydratase subunit beta [Agrobacterium tumefaciens]